MSKVKSSFNKELKTELIKISKKYDLDLLVLFGSRAKGDFTKESDWDFAYYSKNELSFKERKKLLLKIMEIVNSENVDLVKLKGCDNVVLLYEIFTNGKLIYESKKGLFDKFEADAWFNFLFYKDSIDYANKNLKNELEKI